MHLSRRRKQTLDRDFYPCDMNGCVLWLPFYKYGANAQKVWDQSISNLGPELISNGGFADTSDWVAASAPYEASIASVSGGVVGNCLQLTRVGGDVQYAYQNRTDLEYGKSYLVSGWVKSGTSGDESFSLHYLNPTLEDKSIVAGTTSSTWTYYSGILDILQPGGTPQIVLLKMSATAGNMLFDSISIREVNYNGGINHGTIIGDVRPSAEYTTVGWGFYGGNLNCGSNSSIQSSVFSYLLWMYLHFSGAYGTFVGGSVDACPQFRINNDNTLSLLSQVTIEIHKTTGVVVDDRWNCLAVTYDASGNSSIYINEAIETTTNFQSLPFLGDTLIGIRSAGQEEFGGYLGDLLFFNRVLSATEIKSYYEKTRRIYGV